MKWDVLYLDNHLLVLNKPAGILVQGDRTGDLDLLTIGKQYLKERFSKPGNVFLGLVHRLDRPVSGVMVFARTSKAASRLSEQFRSRRVDKNYLALVEGELKGRDRLTHFLVKQDRSVRVVSPSFPGARRAVLDWSALASEGQTSLVKVQLETGRPHQIRVQLAHLGYPILGDRRYGAKRKLDGRNIALHCYRMEIEHPTRKELMHWTAPPPISWGERFNVQIQSLLSRK